MNFWEAQIRARKITIIYFIAFILLALVVAYLSEKIMRFFAADFYNPPYPIVGLAFLAIAALVAGFNQLMYRQQGGSYVAAQLGARKVDPFSEHPKERQLIQVVNEMALASAMPMPEVYVLPAEEINAFAAGLTPEKAAVTVTQGALDKLDRNELSGVIGHEFGHIANADMKINLRVAAFVLGFYFIFMLGTRFLSISRHTRMETSRRIDFLFLVAIIMLLAGLLSYFAGAILQCAISRQREYLADATSVQFNRSTEGLTQALKRIAKDQAKNDMPLAGMPYAHLYFNNAGGALATLFATHPSIEKRISALLGKTFQFTDS